MCGKKKKKKPAVMEMGKMIKSLENGNDLNI